MQFNSIEFFLFFMIGLFIYYKTPSGNKKWQILIYSLLFYSCFSIYEVIFLLLMGVVSWIGELLIEKYKNRALFTIMVILLILPLILLKYFDLFPGAILPVGISFFTLQAVSSVTDVYLEKNKRTGISEHITYLSFFPTVVSGPILRKGSFIKELEKEKIFCYEEVRNGFYRIAIGYLEKFFLADRIGKIVNYIFSIPNEVSGIQVIIGTILFGWQLYYDFAGYSHMCLGFAKCFGISIMENFERPYFSTSVKEFWSRWHRSLSSWLKDYVYIPLGGNQKGKLTRYRNLMLTFLVSGVWHGVGLNFIFWGFLHGLYQIIEDLLKDKNNASGKEGSMIRGIKTIFVFCLVDFAWLFFRASDVKTAFIMLQRIITDFHPQMIFGNWWFEHGMGKLEYLILVTVIIFIFIFDKKEEQGASLLTLVKKQKGLVRWALYIIVLFYMIMTFMIGIGNDTSTFLYQNF